MSLSRPNAVLTVGGQDYSAAEAALVRLRISLGISGSHDAAELTLWPASKLKDAAAGDTLEISLGDLDGEEAVFTGEVTQVIAGADALVVEGLAATVALSRARRSQTYVSQSVADIVKDLASDIDVDQVQGDLQLDAYSLDDRRTLWSHVLDLASLTGADVGCSAEGGLRFSPFESGSADVSLRYGADVLAWHAGPRPAPAVPTVVASGAASDAGAEKWHWLTRDPAGGSTAARVVAAFRTKDAADQLNQALADRAARAGLRGQVTLVGRPDVRPGARVEVTDLPSGDLGTLRVLAVEHVLDSRSGFITSLTVESAEGGGA
jgi:phage protein D